MPTESRTAVGPHSVFGDSYCDHLIYRIRVKRKAFHLESFLKAARNTDGKKSRTVVACSPANPASDYHLHVAWRTRKDVDLTVEFVKGPGEPDKDEQEPFAEQFFRWVEPFFVDKKVEVEVHADFSYLTKDWDIRFLLPLKAAIGPQNSEAEIDGISFSLPSKPKGIWKVWLTLEAKHIWVHVVAQRVLELERFDAKADIKAMQSVLKTVLREERTQ